MNMDIGTGTGGSCSNIVGFCAALPLTWPALFLHLKDSMLVPLQTDNKKRLSETLRPDYCQRQDTELNDPLLGSGLAIPI